MTRERLHTALFTRNTIFLCLAAAFCVSSLVFLCGVYNVMFRNVLHKMYQVSPESPIEDIWLTTPVPMVMKVYVFNITNPEGFVKGAKPKLQEIGPYVYREYHSKEKVVYHLNDTVSYFQKRWWFWDQEKSGKNSPDDEIIVLNTIPVAAAFSVESYPSAIISMFNRFMNWKGEQALVRTTVGKVLFDGFEDPILTMMNNTDNPFIKQFMPEDMSNYDKFAWFYKRNNSLTYDGYFNMFTGKSGLDKVGLIDLWNRSNKTKFFDEPCNHVTGSAGELWPPSFNKSYIKLYNPDLCMTAKLDFLKEVTDSFGFPAFRYFGSDQTFANKSYNEDHKCLCVKGRCGPNGLLNAQSCRMGAPAYVSFPHFLNADPDLLKQVEGLKPDPEKHQFYIDVNPDMGIPLGVAARIQINMDVKPYPGDPKYHSGKIDILEKVPKVILPVIWFEVLSSMSEDLAGQMRPAFFFTSKWPITILSLLFVVGVVFTSFFVYRFVKKIRSLN